MDEIQGVHRYADATNRRQEAEHTRETVTVTVTRVVIVRERTAEDQVKTSQDQTATLLLLLLGQKSGARCMFKDLAYAFIGLGRTFEVFVGIDLLSDFFTLCSRSQPHE